VALRQQGLGATLINEEVSMKVHRITLVVDEEWLNTINEVCSYVENGEVCYWESVSDPFDIDPYTYNMTDEEFYRLME
jgi:hypothetical protein